MTSNGYCLRRGDCSFDCSKMHINHVEREREHARDDVNSGLDVFEAVDAQLETWSYSLCKAHNMQSPQGICDEASDCVSF